MPTSVIATQQHCWHQDPSLPTSTTHQPPLTPTATTHHSNQLLMPPTTIFAAAPLTMVGGRGVWRQWGASVVDGGDGWQQLMAPVGGKGKKLFKKLFQMC